MSEDAMHLFDGDLRGLPVIGADGHAFGEVSSVVLDADSWRVLGLQIRLRRDIAEQIGAPRSLLHPTQLVVPIAHVRSVKDAVLLDLALGQLEGIGAQHEGGAPLQQ